MLLDVLGDLKLTQKRPTTELALHVILDELESRLERADATYADAQWRGNWAMETNA